MLKTKSFNITDSDGVNELLAKYRLAEGATIFVSNGEIMVPYEDGEPVNNALKIIAIKEDKNKAIHQREIIEHSQLVLDFLISNAKDRVAEEEANLAEAQTKEGKKKYDDTKSIEERLKGHKSALTQLEQQHQQNAHEIVRYTINCEMYDKKVAELSS